MTSLLLYAAEEIRRLRRQMEELRKESGHYIDLLKAHDINFLEDPTVHWKGKQRCAKVAKVTPTHQLPKGIIVYSNGNVICPAGKEPVLEKQCPEAVLVQPTPDVNTRVRVNGVLHVNSVFSPPSLLPGATVAPLETTTALRVVDTNPALPPSVSYITLQIPAVSTTLPQQPQSAVPPHNITIAATPVSQLSTQPVVSLATVTQAVTHSSTAVVADVIGSSVSEDNTMRTVSYTIPSSTALLGAGAAGSTQTTWTTLHLTGNTVQPVCQSVSTLEGTTTNQTLQQLTVCPVSNKPTAQPIQIQIRPQVPLQQAPTAAHIQAQPIQRLPQLHSALLTQTHPQPMLTPQPQCAVLPQPAVVAPAVMSQPQPSVLQPASVVPHLQTTLIPQPKPQPLPQPQPRATVLPLLQTMQVLQVNPSGATVSGVTTPQNTNNPSVVILQQGNACSSQSTVREELANQMSCQHIVIIQAPNQTAPAPQNPQVGIVPAALPAAVPALPTQIVTTNCTTTTTNLHTVGGKQLVHILPRPVPPQMNPSQQGIQASSAKTAPSAAPQTITVNGQVFALQPMNTTDKAATQGNKSTLQLVQPTTAEEPTTNVALNSLGALSSLNKSISQGLPLTITSQTNLQIPAAPPSVVQQQQQQPTSAVAPAVQEAAVNPPSRQLQAPPTNPLPPVLADATKATQKKTSKVVVAKKGTSKRIKPPKRRELRQAQATITVAAKPVVAAGDATTAGNVKDCFPVGTTASTPSICSKVTADGKTPENVSKSRSKMITVSNSSSEAVICSQPLQQQSTTSVSSTLKVSQTTASINVKQSEVIVSRPSGAVTSPPAVNVTTAEPTATGVKSKPVSVVGGSSRRRLHLKSQGHRRSQRSPVTEASVKLPKPVCSTGSSRKLEQMCRLCECLCHGRCVAPTSSVTSGL